ncbi:GNAT family N-acetyltransferase [Alkalimarinus sediminis]|uniref:GNAT family N-acetyltransferase n=1 Tax=Alkalimarinus sediminis TaxID=1632866 RepID=A0A9E8KRB3_9ALTE|nr:GNAT family N-acetyltransferase [Alkalimarinus sediminis]UZW76160.1 GNAT family N-acetyltransferase [Alkalimarinus sediminis]
MNSKLNVTITPQISDLDSHSETFISNQTADSLFNSVAWQNAWWSRWGRGLELTVTRVNVGEDTLCKLPLYIDPFKFKHIFPIRRLQFIGTNYQNISTPRAEYLAFSTVKGYESALMRGLSAIEPLNWNEFVARDIVKGECTDKAITQWAKDKNWLTRVIHTDTAYSINTTTSFEDYKKNLGSNTRLKLINRRKLLETFGDVAIENYYPDRVTEFFDLMNGFHERRWGDTFSSKTLSFHQEIINNSQQGGLEVDLSVLTVNGQCESVMFNYVLGGRVYNINSGFNERFNKKIAIGMLHFGYMIEAAFINPDTEVFDFLAGHGKNSNYKSALATDSVELYSIQLIRSRTLIMLYHLKTILDNVKKNIMLLSNFIFKWVK